MQGDDGPLLVTRRACFTPRKSEGKVCKLVIDSGSCENVVSEEAVQKLGLATEKHPNPTNYLGSKGAMR